MSKYLRSKSFSTLCVFYYRLMIYVSVCIVMSWALGNWVLMNHESDTVFQRDLVLKCVIQLSEQEIVEVFFFFSNNPLKVQQFLWCSYKSREVQCILNICIYYCMYLLFSCSPPDVGDHSREVGCCHQKERWRCCPLSAGASSNLRWSSSAPWRSRPGAGEPGGKDHQTG